MKVRRQTKQPIHQDRPEQFLDIVAYRLKPEAPFIDAV